MAQLQNAGAVDRHDHSLSMTSGTRSPGPPDALGGLRQWNWPSQAYHCSFCTRVFRTAQALGGHMNIHRRERASITTNQAPPPPTRAPHHLHPRPRPALPPPHLHLHTFTGPWLSCNGGYGKLNLVADPAYPRTGSDALTWLLSQLPPPEVHGPSMRSNVVKPYDCGVAVCKLLPGVQRHVGRIHTDAPGAPQGVVYTGLTLPLSQSLERNDLESSSGGGWGHDVEAPEEDVLDLELRL